ncbi:MAG: SGNH/GDSL hydrolase family protein [Oscillospiraceae bacterium]|nr:SGNH/GDSL hydrolase family protein [Oscillospiraceae bacterium]
MNQKLKNLIRILASVLIVITVLFLLQKILVPKYVTGIVEGAFVAEYYKEENKDFDVVFVGDCEVYENFSTATLWEEYGINSYIRGSAEQYIWQSYYLLKDCMRYHKPKVAVFNIQSMQFNESQSEAYNRMSIEGMKWSFAKIGAIRASMTAEEHFLDYVFPILRYHSRWSELSGDDFRYMFNSPNVSFNGYFMRVDTRPVDYIPDPVQLPDYRFGEKAWKYLDEIRKLCKKNDVRLIFVKAPSLYPTWYDEYENQVEEYAEMYGIPYYNFLELTEEVGLDYSTDTYDAGLHLNINGAEKMSHYFGNILSEQFGIDDRRGDPQLDAAWAKEIGAYEAEIDRQCVLYGVDKDTLYRYNRPAETEETETEEGS